MAGGNVLGEGPPVHCSGLVWVGPKAAFTPLHSPSWPGSTTSEDRAQVFLPLACWVTSGSPLPSLSFSFLKRRKPGAV